MKNLSNAKKVKMNGMKMESYNLDKYLLSTVYLWGKTRNKWQDPYTSALESCMESLYGTWGGMEKDKTNAL